MGMFSSDEKDWEEAFLNAKLAKEKEQVIKLVDSILEWWENHEYDTVSNGEDEYNVYDDEPDFVKLAKEIKAMTI